MLQPQAALVLNPHAEFGFGAGGHEFDGFPQLPSVIPVSTLGPVQKD